MIKIKIDIPAEVTGIIEKLNRHKYEAYIVGGCVRDSVLGKTPKDWDITTSAKPNEVLSVFKDYRTIPTGLQHGTVTVMINDVPFEITTFRVDGKYLDHRHPSKVKFIKNLKDDLARRDFTINAMAYANETLYDPFDGYGDLHKYIVRCVNDPGERFQEDALRMMRAVRFATTLGFVIDRNTYYAIGQNAALLNNVSIERIRSEFDKIILNSTGLYYLLDTGLAREFIPELCDIVNVGQNNKYHTHNVLGHTVKVMAGVPKEKPHLKLAALFHDFGKPDCKTTDENGYDHFYGHPVVSAEKTERIMRRMRYDNDTIQKVVMLVAHHDFELATTRKSVRKLMNKMGDLFDDLMVLKKADILAHSDGALYQVKDVDEMIRLAEKILQDDECFTMKDLALNGDDLIGMGYAPSKMMGTILKNVLEQVIEGNLPNEKDALINFVQNCGQ